MNLNVSKTYENSFLYMLNILSTLTPTELDVLYMMSKGYSRTDICKERQVEMSTVKTQIHNILKKFQKRTMKDLLSTIEDLSLLEIVVKNRIDY